MIADLFVIKSAPKYGKGAKGLFATQFIPRGTITDFRCKKCGIYSRKELARLPKKEHDFVIEHEVMEESGMYSKLCDKRMLYDNHSCNANTLNAHILGYGNGGVGLAVRGIKKGEEATSDYRLNEEEEVRIPGGCRCGAKNCVDKTVFKPPAPKKLQKFWDDKINAALKLVPYVKQPLKKELLKEYPELKPVFSKGGK